MSLQAVSEAGPLCAIPATQRIAQNQLVSSFESPIGASARRLGIIELAVGNERELRRQQPVDVQLVRVARVLDGALVQLSGQQRSLEHDGIRESGENLRQRRVASPPLVCLGQLLAIVLQQWHQRLLMTASHGAAQYLPGPIVVPGLPQQPVQSLPHHLGVLVLEALLPHLDRFLDRTTARDALSVGRCHAITPPPPDRPRE